MQPHYREQLARVDRLLDIVLAPDQTAGAGNLDFEDVLYFACQSIWHLKDWIMADESFHALDKRRLLDDIHGAHCLMVCADIANGSKHATIKRPKTSATLSEDHGIYLDNKQGIYQVFYYLHSSNPSDSYHGIEIRPFLRECRAAWQHIIDTHYLSELRTILNAGAPGS